MTIVIPSRLNRPEILDLVETCKQVDTTVIVHTTFDSDPVPGTVTVRSVERNISWWWLTGIQAHPGPTLLLNDDITATPEALRTMLDALDTADLVTLPKNYGTTPLSGWCFGLNPDRLRPDVRFRWYYTEDAIWMTAKARNLRIATVDVDVVHVRGDKPLLPAEFRDAAREDRRMFNELWG